MMLSAAILSATATSFTAAPRSATMNGTVVPLSLSGCETWYDTTSHGSSFRSVKAFEAKSDGSTDDTEAIQKAIVADIGSNLQKKPSLVYLPPRRYLINDTLVMYYHSHLVGSLSAVPRCAAQVESLLPVPRSQYQATVMWC
eukprot:COSAG02_NODE_7892_length_2802_cov_17.610063_3_plen_142_part_00